MSGGSVRPTCPNGGIWHICLTSPSQYVGCCKSNPCSNAAGCPPEDITAASFEPEAYGTFPDQSCGAGQGLFYTCTFPGESRTPFIGCCRSDPCKQSGCPAADLGAASVDPAVIQSFITAVGGLGVMSFATTSAGQTASVTTASDSLATDSSASSSGTFTSLSSSSSFSSSSASSTASSTTTTSSSTSNASSTQSSATPGATSNGDPFSGAAGANDDGQVSKGTVAGVTVASIVIVAAIAAILLFICTRRRRMERQLCNSHKSIETVEVAAGGIPHVSSGGLFSPQRSSVNRRSHPFPTYAGPAAATAAAATAGAIGVAKHPGQRGSSESGQAGGHSGGTARGSNERTTSYNSQTGRYYTSSASSIYSRTSPAPPYDLQQRMSMSPPFPSHPTMLSGLRVANPEALDELEDDELQAYLRDAEQQHSRHSSGVGYAVPMLPQDLWPATSLATVHEIASDRGDSPSSARSSSAGMSSLLASAGGGGGQRSLQASPTRGSVSRDYAAGVVLARSPSPSERNSGRWSNGVLRPSSLVGEVHENSGESS